MFAVQRNGVTSDHLKAKDKVLIKKRLVDIDKGKGLAIFLVVLGHIVATDLPQGNEWFGQLKEAIYRFHMPFFMFISGLIMAYGFKRIDSIATYSTYIWKKIVRLAPGFILFGLLIYIGKITLSPIMYVDDVPNDFISEIYLLFIIPANSAGGSLWFIYVLMEMYIIFPILITVMGGNPIFLVIIGVALHFIPAPHYLMLDRVFEYFMFFSLGVLAIRYYEFYLELIDKYCIFFIGIFLSSFLLTSYIPPAESKMVISLFSLPALHGLVRRAPFSKMTVWNLFGAYTYSIYLMNTITIGVTKGIILKFTSWDGSHFLWIAPLLFLAGMCGPIVIKKYIFVKFPLLDKVTT